MQIEAKFHMKPIMHRETKVCSNGPCHMTQMADMTIYKNTSDTIFSETEWLMTLKLGMQHLGLRSYQVCSNDDPWLALTCFTSRSSSVT